ncbi:uncharacterized protein [Procambarus clarkii]|uniref:uncharacterized protein n=1 Tax=Procambarus clarkii TaxID=6728 RepID=UPI003743EA7E
MECCTAATRGHRLVLERCCCCCSLQTGALIIASLEIVVCLALIITVLTQFSDDVGQIFELIAHIVIAFVLIYGVKKSRRHLVVGWLWMRGVVVIMDFIILALDSIVFHSWLLLVLSIVTTVILCYTMLVVRSYVLTMSEAEEEDKVHLEEVTAST